MKKKGLLFFLLPFTTIAMDNNREKKLNAELAELLQTEEWMPPIYLLGQAESLVGKGANPKAITCDRDSRCNVSQLQYFLAHTGRDEYEMITIINWLLKRKTPLNNVESVAIPALIRTISRCRFTVTSFLIEKGADVTENDTMTAHSPLIYGVRKESQGTVKLILEKLALLPHHSKNCLRTCATDSTNYLSLVPMDVMRIIMLYDNPLLKNMYQTDWVGRNVFTIAKEAGFSSATGGPIIYTKKMQKIINLLNDAEHKAQTL